jgi:hypothetical protein
MSTHVHIVGDEFENWLGAKGERATRMVCGVMAVARGAGALADYHSNAALEAVEQVGALPRVGACTACVKLWPSYLRNAQVSEPIAESDGATCAQETDRRNRAARVSAASAPRCDGCGTPRALPNGEQLGFMMVRTELAPSGLVALCWACTRKVVEIDGARGGDVPRRSDMPAETRMRLITEIPRRTVTAQFARNLARAGGHSI